MTSIALQTWRTDRAHRVDALVRLHHRVAAMTEIPALAVEQLGPMLVVTLAAEWQGFARDLHDDAVKHIVADVRKTHVPAGDRLEALLLRRRRLDRGNADHSALNDDFRLLGINRLWDRIQQYDAQAMDLRYELDQLMRARNAIAHADRAVPVVLTDSATTSRRRTALDHLAEVLDASVADHLTTMFGGEQPW